MCAAPDHSTPRRLSRRRFVATLAAGAGVGALGLGRYGSDLAAAIGLESVALEGPGSALHTADRLGVVAKVPVAPPPGKIIFPVDVRSDCYVLDNFGDCRGTNCSRRHEGLDIMGSRGQAVYAVAAGVLTKRYTNTGTAGWGWTLYDAATATTYKYFHLTENPAGRSLGSRVEVGDVIGYVGDSGTTAGNYHLHFEVRPNDVAVDPLPVLHVDTTVCRTSPPLRG
jgi:peptidoglycan LD-endopeptidase LytH